VLKNGEANIQETANLTGLSGTARIHDLFINIEGMTPGEFKNKGENIRINYSFYQSHFGQLIIASTPKGICYIAFIDNETDGYKALNGYLPNADFHQQTDPMHANALCIFTRDWSNIAPIKLHLKGTDFQLKVWQTLLKIPFGNLSTYGNIAKNIQQPNASRAVGTAIGKNPIAYLIPCHRVIQSSGIIGGYMWGSVRKKALIGWEGCTKNSLQFDIH
jgi:AraC family transcriptional regulator, regulatory protein of adaptative response / methylated-DNA-[protein]-cysteine methyltransferase